MNADLHTRAFFGVAVFAVIMVFVVGCGDTVAPNHSSAVAGEDDQTLGQNYATYDGLDVETRKVTAIGVASSEATLVALSACHCGTEVVRQIFERMSQSRRVLPQVLVPKIRDEIQKNTLLSTLDQLPGGLGDLLKAIAVNDEKIAAQIRDGVKANMKTAINALGTSPFLDQSPFRFDLFYPPVTSVGEMPLTFSVTPLATYWNLVFGADDLWNIQGGSAAVADLRKDVGAQALEVTRVFAEWAYILGIGSDGNPNGMGGLAFDLQNGLGKFSVAQNPASITEDQARFISGDYVISYPQDQSALQMSKIKENWHSNGREITLPEQASVWRAAAMAFSRMRSDKVGLAKALFTGDGAPLTNSSRLLPLIWLPAMATFLDKYFIDQSSHTIFEKAQLPGAEEKAEASLDSLTKLGLALQAWIIATSDLAKTDLPADVRARLADVSGQLKDPLRLTLVTILNRFTTVARLEGENWLTFNDEEHLDDDQINAAIGLLLAVEQSVLEGDLLKSKAKALFHWYVAKKFMASRSQPNFTPAAMAWFLHNTRRMENYSDSPVWVHALGANLDTAMGEYVP